MNKPEDQKNEPFKQFGGSIGALSFIIILTTLTTIQEMFCPDSKCSLTPDLEKFKDISTYFDWHVSLISIFYFTYQTVLSIFPIGGTIFTLKTDEYGSIDYNLNSLFVCVTNILFMITLQLYDIDVITYVLKHWFHFSVSFMIIANFITVYAYVRSFSIDPRVLNYRVVGNDFLSEFFLGRECQPQVAEYFNLKTFLIKIGLHSSIILQLLLLAKGVLELPYENYPTIIVAFIIHSYYLSDAILREEIFLTSFEVQKEGCGLMSCVAYSVYPFLICSLLKRLVYQSIVLPNLLLIIVLLWWRFGMWLYEVSNRQKHYFKKYPTHPTVKDLKTINTEKGKILVDGYWGIVRKPNYLGDIIQTMAYIPFCGIWEFFIVVVQVILLFFHRVERDDQHCSKKYGKDWNKYCQAVKYKLIPFIY